MRHAVVKKAVYSSNLLQDLEELRMETAVLRASRPPDDVKGKYHSKLEGLSQDRKKQRNRKSTATIKCVELEEQDYSQETHELLRAETERNRAEQLAKMLVQMLWHLKAVSVTRPVVPQIKGGEYLTSHTRDEEEGKG